jgi:hypothetical protein
MFAKGLLWTLLARTVTRRLGWLPLVWMVARSVRQKQARGRPARRR